MPMGHDYAGKVGFLGVAHGVSLAWSLAHVHGGPAPVRRFLPELIGLMWDRKIDPGKVTLPLDRAADGYQAMDQRDAARSMSPSTPPTATSTPATRAT
jgi:threonine dehydrogenase-like Zn-dependent dehydrogenase